MKLKQKCTDLAVKMSQEKYTGQPSGNFNKQVAENEFLQNYKLNILVQPWSGSRGLFGYVKLKSGCSDFC